MESSVIVVVSVCAYDSFVCDKDSFSIFLLITTNKIRKKGGNVTNLLEVKFLFYGNYFTMYIPTQFLRSFNFNEFCKGLPYSNMAAANIVLP